MEQFKWISFYTEFATKLLAFIDNRSELIKKIVTVYNNIGIKLPKLEYTEIPIDIDPFTIFALFNKGITDQNRSAILSGIKKEFLIEAEVPSNYDGIPVLTPQNSTFYHFKGDRNEDDIDNLWNVFVAAIAFSDNSSNENKEDFIKAFDKAITQKSVKWNLTMGLYWIRPYVFINFDSRNRWFLGDSANIDNNVAEKVRALKDVPSASNYLQIRDLCLDELNSGKYDYKSFPELSYASWFVSEKSKKDAKSQKNMEPLILQFVERIIKEYPVEKQKPFANNQFGDYIRNTVPESFYKTEIINKVTHFVRGSVGKGNWARIPWLAIFDLDNTNTAQEGQYIIYLLSNDKKTLYLTFNQGCTNLLNQYGIKKTLEIVKQNAFMARQKINPRGFSTDEMDLHYPHDSKAQLYEAGMIFSKAYNIDELPSEKELRDDFSNMIEIYKDYNKLFSKNNKKQEHTGKAWLISWNPQNWEWVDFEKHCIDTSEGTIITMQWACSSKKAHIGDEVYMLRTGNDPRGIIAHGFVSKESFDAPHYDQQKAEAGLKINKIEVDFDRILNYKKETIIDRETLVDKFPDQEWSPMSSGIAIKDEYVPTLRRMWFELTNNDDEEIVGKLKKNNINLNTILYGPPGTGKTYNLAIYAVAICDNKSLNELTDYDAVIKRYEELKEKNRIAFTTFHQSYSYEEFIEGIKPVVDTENSGVNYRIESGVFKKFCEIARVVQEDDVRYTGAVWTYRNKTGDKGIDNNFEKRLYDEGVIKIEDIEDDNHQCGYIKDMSSGDWVVLGRNNLINAIGIITDNEPEEINDGIFHYQRKVDWKAKNLNVDCRSINRGKVISNFTIAASWMKITDLQRIIDGDKENVLPHVFIIDEINRGNISKIFGELITLIEDTKREGMKEEASATLPYSEESFSVPSNVYILGTMNTADRSIALMDTALRRRFDFVEKMPEASLLKDINVSDDIGNTVNVGELLEIINKRIEFLFDREHTIGHAFFMKLKENCKITVLSDIFKRSVIPLLQEYFYEDYEKIQLVLGDTGKDKESPYKFIKNIEVKPTEIFFDPKNVEKSTIYSINEEAFDHLESYIGIIKKEEAKFEEEPKEQ